MPNPVLGIDAIRMITTAIEATKSTDSTVLAKYMANIKDMQGMTGKLTIDPKTHNPLNKQAVIEMVKDGKFKFYKSVQPKDLK
jgi:branched-chain amino acid transport system substrate-binding protein